MEVLPQAACDRRPARGAFSLAPTAFLEPRAATVSEA